MTSVPMNVHGEPVTAPTFSQHRAPRLARRRSRLHHVPSSSVSRAIRLANWLDRRFVDPIVGFVFPGLGDVLSSTVGLYIVGVAIHAGLPLVVIARMMINLAVDALFGAIPLVGDLFDLWFQANRRNVDLLTDRYERGASSPSDWLVVLGAAALCLAAISLPFVIVISTFMWIF